MLQDLLLALQRLVLLELVEEGQAAEHLGEAVALRDVQELKRLHLEAKRRIDEQQHQIGHPEGGKFGITVPQQHAPWRAGGKPGIRFLVPQEDVQVGKKTTHSQLWKSSHQGVP